MASSLKQLLATRELAMHVFWHLVCVRVCPSVCVVAGVCAVRDFISLLVRAVPCSLLVVQHALVGVLDLVAGIACRFFTIGNNFEVQGVGGPMCFRLVTREALGCLAP